MSDTLPDRADILEVLIDEVLAMSERFREAGERLRRHPSGTDAHEDAEVELATASDWLALKAQAVSDFLEEDDAVSLIRRLEKQRTALGDNDRPLSVENYLSHIRDALGVSAAECPSQATYWRWLKEARLGKVKISPAHEALLERFIENAEVGAAH